MDKESVVAYVNTLPEGTVVVSGGCEGVDTWAIDRAKELGLKWKIFFPDFKGAKTYGDLCKRYYARNEEVVKFSDVIVAFVSDDRKGGTENTIKWAKKYGKPVIIMKEEKDAVASN
jgi:predicted Rossmann fold nucleotide-binding protein DprA/Smf involved in DNA uptake